MDREVAAILNQMTVTRALARNRAWWSNPAAPDELRAFLSAGPGWGWKDDDTVCAWQSPRKWYFGMVGTGMHISAPRRSSPAERFALAVAAMDKWFPREPHDPASPPAT